MSSDGKPVVGSRVNQLDADELDGELFSLFKARLADVFKHVDGSFYPTYEPEIKAVLKALLYGFTVWDCGSTVGQRLLGLEYFAGRDTVKRASRAQILALVSVSTLLPWLRERWLGVYLRRLSHHRRSSVERGLGHLETAFRVASVANFVLFLLRGTYCSLSTRLTGVINGHVQRPMIREVQFDFMNRELLWHGLAEFVGFLLPLVNIYPAKNFVNRKLLHRKTVPTSPCDRTPSDLARCAICAGVPTQPHEIGCRHVFCYYCVASQVTADPNFSCPLCNCPSLGLDNLREAALPLKQD
ncbi:unnamed protein product [Ixodes hexagonus]